MVRETSCNAEMEFVDVSAIADATDSSSAYTYQNLEKLKANEEESPYGTGELNQFILDGTKEILPDDVDVAYWSEKSNAECLFDKEQYIVRTFTQPHTSSGITLYFLDDYPTSVHITWYAQNNTKIVSKLYQPNAKAFFCRELVSNYYSVKIEFLETRNPYQYVKLQYIMHGQHLEWSNDYISSANTTEEVDLTMATLSINKCTISVLDTNDDFNLENETGNWKAIQKTQPLSLYEIVDSKKRNRGVYYIDSFSSEKKTITFDLIDGIGLMDNYQFESGSIYKNEVVGPIFDEIFSVCGITNYSVSDEIRTKTVSGWLEIQTCREALQMLAFSCGAIVDQDENGTINVKEATRTIVNSVPKSRKFMDGSSIELDEYVSGVSIEYDTYTLSSDSEDVFKGELQAGTSKILFSDPIDCSSISISPSGSIIHVSTNYAIVSVDDSDEYVITGKKYESITSTYAINVDSIDANEKENIKAFGTVTLIPSGGYEEVARKLLDYFSLRLIINMKILVEDEYVANWSRIEQSRNKNFYAFFESLETDLSGGFIAKAKCRGYSSVIHEDIYANEIYMNEEIGVI